MQVAIEWEFDSVSTMGGKDILGTGSIVVWCLSISCFKPFLFSAWRVCMPRSLKGRDWFFWGKTHLHKLIQNCRLPVLEALSCGGRKKGMSWDFWVKFPFSLTTVPHSEDPPVARSGGSGRGFHCESKAASPGAWTKGHFPRMRKETTALCLVNPRQEVWR